MRAPDVALISPYPPPGPLHATTSGVASYTANLARALVSEGVGVTVVAPHGPGHPATHFDQGIVVERSFRPGPRALPAAARAALATGAPAVHVQHELFLYGGRASVPGIFPALLRVRRERGAVLTLHQVVDPARIDPDFTRLHRTGMPAPLARAGMSALQRGLGRLGHATLVHEPAFARVLPEAVVVPHGVETTARADRDRARRELGLNGFTALCFGFVAPYKGLESALAAAAAAGAGDGVELVIAGGEHPRLAASRDPYARNLQRTWSKTARFTGYVAEEDIPRWFAACDVALLLYPRPHAASGALALALAHGTPPLLSAALAEVTGAPPELIAPSDPRDLGRLLGGLASAPRRVEDLRRASAALGSGRAWPAVARRHAEIYEEVIHARRAGRRGIRVG